MAAPLPPPAIAPIAAPSPDSAADQEQITLLVLTHSRRSMLLVSMRCSRPRSRNESSVTPMTARPFNRPELRGYRYMSCKRSSGRHYRVAIDDQRPHQYPAESIARAVSSRIESLVDSDLQPGAARDHVACRYRLARRRCPVRRYRLAQYRPDPIRGTPASRREVGCSESFEQGMIRGFAVCSRRALSSGRGAAEATRALWVGGLAVCDISSEGLVFQLTASTATGTIQKNLRIVCLRTYFKARFLPNH